MFEVGDKVRCIDARACGHSGAAPLVEGEIYVVRRIRWWGGRCVAPDGTRKNGSLLLDVGVPHPDAALSGVDGWGAFRFRKLPKLDTSAGLATVKSLFTTPRLPIPADT